MLRALAIAIALAWGSVQVAPAAGSCTHETFTVEGTPLTVEYCVSGPARADGTDEVVVPVTATYSTAARTLRRVLELHFISGEPVSRVLASLDLVGLGLTGTLHLTLAYSQGLVRVEGALLTPGAITIK